jgi:hypothetical protein
MGESRTPASQSRPHHAHPRTSRAAIPNHRCCCLAPPLLRLGRLRLAPTRMGPGPLVGRSNRRRGAYAVGPEAHCTDAEMEVAAPLLQPPSPPPP